MGSFHFQLRTRIGTTNRHDETITHMRKSFVGVSDRFMERRIEAYNAGLGLGRAAIPKLDVLKIFNHNEARTRPNQS
jgi:hypothetical protein